MSVAKTIAVAGATGFVGRYIAKELLARGHRVRALIRDRTKAEQVLDRRVDADLVVGDVLDGRSPHELLGGCDACVNAIGILRESPGGQTFTRMHAGATEALVDASKALSVGRFVQVSALGVRAQGASAYQRTKWDAELIVRRSGLDWTIFRPSMIHAPDSGMMQELSKLVTGKSPPYKFMPYFARAVTDTSVCMGPTRYQESQLQPVAVQDVAACVAAAIDTDDAIGEVYTLTGPETFTWPELLEFLRDTLPEGSPGLKPRRVPGDLAIIGAKLAGALGLGALLPFDAGMVVMATEDGVANTGKARDHLGFDPAPFREGVRAYAARV